MLVASAVRNWSENRGPPNIVREGVKANGDKKILPHPVLLLRTYAENAERNFRYVLAVTISGFVRLLAAAHETHVPFVNLKNVALKW